MRGRPERATGGAQPHHLARHDPPVGAEIQIGAIRAACHGVEIAAVVLGDFHLGGDRSIGGGRKSSGRIATVT